MTSNLYESFYRPPWDPLSTVTLQLGLNYKTSWTPGWKYWLWSLQKAARLSSRLPGIDVASAQDFFWGCHRLALHRLATKLSNVGADADGLAFSLHRPTNGD
jgi:hypothetical protein